MISVATILRIEQYSAKRLLFKLLLMALLINFSRSIAGFLIQISQIFMLFFINAFSQGNSINQKILVNVLNAHTFLDISSSFDQIPTDLKVDMPELIGALVLITIVTIVSIVVVGIITLVLLFRIIFLWMLLIFTPLVFLLHAVPSGIKYASQWWNLFGKYVLVGPVMAFFLYISIIATSGGGESGDGIQLGNFGFDGRISLGDQVTSETESATVDDIVAVAKIQNSINFFNYLIGTALLIGALWATSQLGVAGGALASKATQGLQHLGTSPFRGARRLTGYTARLAGKGALGAGKFVGKTGYKAGKGVLEGMGAIPLAESAYIGLKHGIKHKALPLIGKPFKRYSAEERERRAIKRRTGGTRTGDLFEKFGGDTAMAKVAQRRNRYKQSIREKMEEEGAFTSYKSRKAAYNAAIIEDDRVKQELSLHSMIASDDQGTSGALISNKYFGHETAANKEGGRNHQPKAEKRNLLDDTYELHQAQSRKARKFANYYMRDSDDEIALRDDEGIKQEFEKKTAGLSESEMRKALTDLKNIPLGRFDSRGVHLLTAISPDNSRIKNSPDNLKMFADSIQTALRSSEIQITASDTDKKDRDRKTANEAILREQWQKINTNFEKQKQLEGSTRPSLERLPGNGTYGVEYTKNAIEDLKKVHSTVKEQKKSKTPSTVVSLKQITDARSMIPSITSGYESLGLMTPKLNAAIAKFESELEKIKIKIEADTSSIPGQLDILEQELVTFEENFPELKAFEKVSEEHSPLDDD